MGEITTLEVRNYLKGNEGKVVTLDNIRNEFYIQKGSKSFHAIRVIMFRLAEEKVVKPTGLRPGEYKVLEPIMPVDFSLDGEEAEGVLDVKYPRSYIDDTTFGLDSMVELSAGDLVLITGETNFGKTAIALSFLGENLDLFSVSILMGSEYTSSAGEISPKLKRRLRRMNWVNWLQDGKPRFNLLPVEHDYEDYVEKDGLTVIDWISLPGEYYLIDRVLKTIKNGEDGGLVFAVTQKNKDAEFSEGGQRAERYADLVLKIDRFGEHESMMTIGKVKAAKGKSPTGRTFAFSISDYGANLQSIREIVKCPKCFKRGYVKVDGQPKKCPLCEGRKFIDKEIHD